jgi:hypothetical protein
LHAERQPIHEEAVVLQMNFAATFEVDQAWKESDVHEAIFQYFRYPVLCGKASTAKLLLY